MVPNSTKVLQITILDIIDWNRIQKYQYSTENSCFEQNSSLKNQIHDTINSKWVTQKGKWKEFEVSSRLKKSFQKFSLAIHLEGWARNFDHECRLSSPKI